MILEFKLMDKYFGDDLIDILKILNIKTNSYLKIYRTFMHI